MKSYGAFNIDFGFTKMSMFNRDSTFSSLTVPK